MPPDPTTTPIAQWTHAATRRSTRRLLAPLTGGAALVLLAAWAVPPMLDWGRFRTQIASIAAARLGRKVTIGGDITLRLLPQAVLTASDVTLGETGVANQGDGISVQVSALRLQVATLPLIAGHLRLRDLVLSAPVLRLPLILPDGIAHPSRPLLPHPFAARIENGTLRIGQAEITGITASIHGGPALASAASTMPEIVAPNGIPVAAFGAEGFANAGGRMWRFTGALGAPDADGVSAIDISIRGQGPAGDTGGTVQATLADGVIQGRLHAGGQDLSLLMPASPQAWHADAPFVASAERIEASTISLSLGGAPADGALSLQLDPPARIEGRLHAATLDLDGWAALLGKTFNTRSSAVQPPARLPRLHVALAAEQAQLLGGTLRDLHATLVSDGHIIGFDDAHAILPGEATLTAPHPRLTGTDPFGAPAPLALSGSVSLSAHDLRATLAWLKTLAPSLVDALPAGVLKSGTLSGEAALRRSGLAVSGLAGQIDSSPVHGGFSIRLGTVPHLDATLFLADLQLDPWLAGTTANQGLATFAQRFAGADTEMHVTASKATWHGLPFDTLALEARSGGSGLQLSSLRASLAGASVNLSGDARPDGRLSAARASITAPDLARLRPFLPERLSRLASGLWRGPASFALAAEGPPDALLLQLRADASDLVLEAEATRDTTAGSGLATLTLRHPGAPRLLSELGLPGGMDAAAAWLDSGSLALRTHLQSRPGHLIIQDFDLNAAALGLSGHFEADWSGATPTVTGAIDAEHLALPASLVPSLGLTIGTWSTQLHIAARNVTVGLRPVARDASAMLAGAGSNFLLDDVSAQVAGGHATGQIAVDLTLPATALRGALSGAIFDRPLTGWPIDAAAGGADVSVDVFSPHNGWATLSGQATASVHDLRIDGIDLAKLGQAAVQHTKPGRALMQSALVQGSSPGLSGILSATITTGQITLAPARLTSPDGGIALSGGADLVRGIADLRLALSPANLGVHLTGPFQNVRSTADPITTPSNRAQRSRHDRLMSLAHSPRP